MNRRTLLAAALVLACRPTLAQTTRSVSLDDLARLRAVSDPQISADGAWVAYTVGTDDTGKDERGSDIWMTSWDGTRQVQMTRSPESETAPRFSPDGKWLAFLAARGDEDEKKKGAQVWLLPRGGGEAQKLTDVKGGVSDFAFSPDGSRLALVVKDPDPDDEPAKKDSKKKTKAPIVVDRYFFKDDGEGYLREFRSHLQLFDVAARKGEPLTFGPNDDESPAWSPDGTSIAFVSKRGPDPDRGNDTNIFVVEARAGAAPRALTSFEGEDGGRPVFSPDGKWVAYLQGEVKKFSAYASDTLAVVSVAGGPARLLTSSLDRAVSGPYAFSPDGTSLLFSVVDDRTIWIGKVPVAGGPVTALTTGRRVVTSLSSAPNGRLAVLATTATEPAEVHALETGSLRRLSRQNDAWLSGVKLATTEDFTSTSADGTVVHGLVVKPAGSAPGAKLPTVLDIHGGPNGQDDHAFSLERELLAASGYAVLAVNYRGSSGRGSAFQKAIFGDWCHYEVVDLLGAVDWAVKTGLADPERLGSGGWSYGGILTDALIATDTRFAAAWAGAGSALQLSMYGTDQYVVQYESEMGPPWKGLEPWLKVSYPFLHADRIRTPTLFMGGESDFNVPISGSEQMYQALRSLGVPTRLVVYPGQRHSLKVPSYVRDRMERVLDWFGRYLTPGGAAAPPLLSPSVPSPHRPSPSPSAAAGPALEKDTIPTSGGDLEVTFVGHGSLVFGFGDRVIHVDPYGKLADYGTLPKADLVLITHAHGDHLDAAALAAIRKPEARILVAPACEGKVEGASVLENGEKTTLMGMTVEAVPAYNLVQKRPDGTPFHPKGEGNGYVVTFGKTRVYVAGDTENVPEMKALKAIDVAFLPMNLPYTMTPEMVADAVRGFGPRILYPYHFGETDPARLMALLQDIKGTEVRVRKMK